MKFNKEHKNNYIIAIGLLQRLKEYLDNQLNPMISALKTYSEEHPDDTERIEDMKEYFEIVKQDLKLTDMLIEKAGINVVLFDSETGETI